MAKDEMKGPIKFVRPHVDHSPMMIGVATDTGDWLLIKRDAITALRVGTWDPADVEEGDDRVHEVEILSGTTVIAEAELNAAELRAVQMWICGYGVGGGANTKLIETL